MVFRECGITRVKRGGSPRNLQYPRDDQFDTYCENFQVDVMSGHQVMTSYVRLCSDEIGRYFDLSHKGARSCFPAYGYAFHESLLVLMDV